MRPRKRPLTDDERGYIAKLLRRCTAQQLATHTGISYGTISNSFTVGLTEESISLLMAVQVEALPKKAARPKGRHPWKKTVLGKDKDAPMYGPGWDR